MVCRGKIKCRKVLNKIYSVIKGSCPNPQLAPTSPARLPAVEPSTSVANIKIIAVIAVQNEEKYLPGFFAHLRDYVDGFVVLDDGSTDKTLDIIKQEKKLCKVFVNKPHGPEGWDEKGNRIRMLQEAKKHGNVVLCCDADERFEINFLHNLRKISLQASEKKQKTFGLHVREIWDNPFQYRCDGVWDTKSKYILFSLEPHMIFDATMPQKHHIPWYHDTVNEFEILEYNIYHLKMLEHEDRVKRVELYEKLDPEHKMQSIGYAYLVDCCGIELCQISEEKKYDYETLPKNIV